MRPSITIRRAELADLPVITEIYNEAILTTTATFDTEPKDASERISWFHAHDDGHPILVAVCENRVVGWASLSRWSDRCSYSATGEPSFYVRSENRGRGIGRALISELLAEANQLRFHTLIARVAQESLASIHLCESFGFERIGTLKEVGRKFGKLLDVHILQKMLR